MIQDLSNVPAAIKSSPIAATVAGACSSPISPGIRATSSANKKLTSQTETATTTVPVAVRPFPVPGLLTIRKSSKNDDISTSAITTSGKPPTETAVFTVTSTSEINSCMADDGDDDFQIPRWKQWRPVTAAERGFRDICAARREAKLPASALKTVFRETLSSEAAADTRSEWGKFLDVYQGSVTWDSWKMMCKFVRLFRSRAAIEENSQFDEEGWPCIIYDFVDFLATGCLPDDDEADFGDDAWDEDPWEADERLQAEIARQENEARAREKAAIKTNVTSNAL